MPSGGCQVSVGGSRPFRSLAASASQSSMLGLASSLIARGYGGSGSATQCVRRHHAEGGGAAVAAVAMRWKPSAS